MGWSGSEEISKKEKGNLKEGRRKGRKDNGNMVVAMQGGLFGGKEEKPPARRCVACHPNPDVRCEETLPKHIIFEP